MTDSDYDIADDWGRYAYCPMCGAPMDPHDPNTYCSVECAIDAEDDSPEDAA